MKKVESFIVVFIVSISVISCMTNKLGSIEVSNVKGPNKDNINSTYISNRQPLTPSTFIKLPIGSIEPKGWLLNILELQKDGMAGHLEEISPWLDKHDNAWLSPTGEGVNGWEEVPYWLKGYGDMAYILKDSAMIKNAEFWINGVLESQREDGYFGAERNRDGRPDLWPNMVMLWCLQSYYDFSEDDRILEFMRNYFRWENSLPDSIFLKDYWGNSRGGDNLYSVYWLYNHIEENWLLELADKIHRNTADWEQNGNLPNWHNVNIAQGFREPALYYLRDKDSSKLKMTYKNFNLVRDIFGQVPGGMFGADENARIGYSDPRQGIETCGVVEQMNSDEMLIRITGDVFWADHCENVAFNTYPAALLPNMKALRYFTSPNMVTSDSTNHSPGIQNKGPYFLMNPLSHRCCQHNFTQGWPYFTENLWMATPDNGIAAILYSASNVNFKVGKAGNEIEIEEITEYPFSDKIKFKIKAKSSVEFPIYLRIPGWTNDASVQINGEKINSIPESNKYLKIVKEWKNGDIIILHLPMGINVNKWEKNKNSISVDYGPLTFSLLIKERMGIIDPTVALVQDAKWKKDTDIKRWPAISITPESSWNYGIVLNSRNPEKGFQVIKKPYKENENPFTPENVPIELKTIGKKIPKWGLDRFDLVQTLPKSPMSVQGEEEVISLIPMGATRLRISSFPEILKE